MNKKELASARKKFIKKHQPVATKAGEKIALALFGVLLGFVVLEIVLRIHNPLAYGVRWDRILLKPNNEIVLINTVNPKLASRIFNSTNSLGFRGEEPPDDFKNRLTIITVGGSTTHCTVSSDTKTWTFLLGEKLKKDFFVWINNAGLNGHSTFGHKVMMEDHVVKLKPKIVIFLVGINDVGGSNDGLFLMYRSRIIKNYLSKSEAMCFLLNTYRIFQAGRLHLPFELSFDINKSGHVNIQEQRIRFEVNFHKNNRIAPFQNRLLDLINYCKQNKIEPILMTQPALYGEGLDEETGVNLETLELRSQNSNGLLEWKILELYNSATRRIGKKTHSLVIDLARKLPKNSELFYDPTHFSDAGNERIAEIIQGELKVYFSQKYKAFAKM